MCHIQFTLGMNYGAKTGNNVSKFMHSNCITEPRLVTMSASLCTQTVLHSYYSSPKHKSLIPKYLIHFSDFHTK